MTCECKECAFRGAVYCEHRKLMDENARLKATINEAKDRMRYYFGEFGGTFPSNPQMQNVYDVLCRDEADG